MAEVILETSGYSAFVSAISYLCTVSYPRQGPEVSTHVQISLGQLSLTANLTTVYPTTHVYLPDAYDTIIR